MSSSTSAKKSQGEHPSTSSSKSQAKPDAPKVTSAVPIPSGRTKYNFPFETMKVGESFFVARDPNAKGVQPVIYMASRFRKANPKYKFMCRAVIETAADGTQISGVRVWCLESPNK